MQVQTWATSRQPVQAQTLRVHECMPHLLCYHMPKPHHAATAGAPVAGKTQCKRAAGPAWLAKEPIFHSEQGAHMAQHLDIASHCSVLLPSSHVLLRACLLAHWERGNQLEVLQHPPPGPCETHPFQALQKVPSPKANSLQPT